jgi:hypothetical protein
MSKVTVHDDEQIQTTEDSGLTPVVFIHRLSLPPSSRDRWRTVSGIKLRPSARLAR